MHYTQLLQTTSALAGLVMILMGSAQLKAYLRSL